MSVVIKVLGLDIGGAHVKWAVSRGGKLGKRKTVPFEIYRAPESLEPILTMIREKARPDCVAVTMTGELSDQFHTRAAGVRWILDRVTAAMAPLEVRVVDINGRLLTCPQALRNPDSVASANWAATAAWVAKRIDYAVLVDIGSTTTDILPIFDGSPAVKGRNDFERLKYGELLYLGYLRTPVSSSLPEVVLDGVPVPVCSEYFALAGDAHLLLGDIAAKDYTAPTPDGRAKTAKAAGERLARAVLSDTKTLGKQRVKLISLQVAHAQAEKVVAGIERIANERNMYKAPIIVIGPGRIYLERLKKLIDRPFLNRVSGISVDLIDPAACVAALWEGQRGTGN